MASFDGSIEFPSVFAEFNEEIKSLCENLFKKGFARGYDKGIESICNEKSNKDYQRDTYNEEKKNIEKEVEEPVFCWQEPAFCWQGPEEKEKQEEETLSERVEEKECQSCDGNYQMEKKENIEEYICEICQQCGVCTNYESDYFSSGEEESDIEGEDQEYLEKEIENEIIELKIKIERQEKEEEEEEEGEKEEEKDVIKQRVRTRGLSMNEKKQNKKEKKNDSRFTRNMMNKNSRLHRKLFGKNSDTNVCGGKALEYPTLDIGEYIGIVSTSTRSGLTNLIKRLVETQSKKWLEDNCIHDIYPADVNPNVVRRFLSKIKTFPIQNSSNLETTLLSLIKENDYKLLTSKKTKKTKKTKRNKKKPNPIVIQSVHGLCKWPYASYLSSASSSSYPSVEYHVKVYRYSNTATNLQKILRNGVGLNLGSALSMKIYNKDQLNIVGHIYNPHNKDLSWGVLACLTLVEIHTSNNQEEEKVLAVCPLAILDMQSAPIEEVHNSSWWAKTLRNGPLQRRHTQMRKACRALADSALHTETS